MIKIEHIITPSPEQMEFVIEGARNPLNSWAMSDSIMVLDGEQYDIFGNSKPYGCQVTDTDTFFELGENDEKLMRRLCQAGSDERKFMRQMPLAMRVTAPLYWWKEFDTYKVATVANSCSTMHKIAAKEFTLDDFSHEHLVGCAKELMVKVVKELNDWRQRYLLSQDKDDWWQLIQLLPSSYNQTRNVTMNYETARNMYMARRNHKLDEWNAKFEGSMCDVLSKLPYSFLITEEKPMDIYKEEK